MSNKIMEMGPIAAEVVILLDIDARKSAQRKERQKKLDRFEKDVEFLSKVRNNYLKEADELFLAHKFAVIDSTRSKEEVFSEVIMNIEPLIVKKIE
jgi:thymidylate kinase